DLLRIGALLQFLEHQHLILVRLVHGRLARCHTLPWHDNGLHTLAAIIIAVDAGRRGDGYAAGGAIDRNHRPRGERVGGKPNDTRKHCTRPAHFEARPRRWSSFVTPKPST